MAREYATPPKYLLTAEARTTDDMVVRAERDPDHVAFGRKHLGAWRPVTSKEFADQVTALAAGLIAEGVRPGDRVALMSATRYEWALCDFAIWTAGAVTVPIYETSSAEQVAWILSDSGASAVFVENERYRGLVEQVRGSGVEHLWLMEGDGLAPLADAGVEISSDQVERR